MANPFADSQGPYEPNPGKPPPFFVEQNKDARNMAMLAHLLGALMGFVGPLIIWLIKKDEHPFVNDQGKEALNFQLTILIGHLIAVFVVVISCGFIFFAPFIPMVMQMSMGIIASTKANNGELYRYPMCIRFIQ